MELVGRSAELRALDAALADARSGRGRLVLVTGTAGMGKTELVTAATSGADITVLWGGGWEAGGAPAYWPWTQVLRGLARERGIDPGADLPRLAHLLPELGIPDPAGVASDGARFALFDAVAAALARAAATAPLAVVVDDLHAAGQPSALLLQFLARELRRSAVLLVATYRPVEVGWQPGMRETVAALEGTATVLALHGLDADGIAQVVGATARAVPPTEVVAAIAARTDGNPLFVTAVARMLAAGEREPGWPVPAGIRQAIRAQVARLAGEPAAVLGAAAVLGRDVEVAVLAAMVRRPAGEVAGQLVDAESAGLLQPRGAGRYRFAHDLVRETLEADLDPRDRARHHARAVDALAGGGRFDDGDTRLAHHALAAAPFVDPATAAGYAERAAEQAMGVAAFTQAAELYTGALAALDLQVPADQELRGRLLTGLGAALVKGGNPPEGRRVLAEAAELARRRGDGRALAAAALLCTERLDFNDVDAPALALLDEAAAALRGSGTAVEARVLARRAVAGYHTDAGERAASGDRAVAAARVGGDPAALALALSARLYVRWGTESGEAMLPHATEIIALAAAAGDAEREVDGRMWRLVALLELGELDEAEHEVHAVDRLAERLRQPLYRLMAASRRSTVALLRGHAGAALEHARRALAIGERGREPDAEAVHWGQVYAIWQEAGLPDEDLERCERIVRALVASSALSVAHVAGLVVLCLGTGRPEEARARFEAIVRRGIDAVPRDMLHLWALTQLATACAALGDVDAAADLAAALEPFAGRCAVGAGAVTCSGAVDHYLGLLASCRGRADEAVGHFTRAAALYRRMGAPGPLARTRLAHAAVLSDRTEAAALLDAAAAGARELGLHRLLAEVSAARDAIADRPVAAPLLAREGEVWAVTWDGRTVRARDAVGLGYLAALVGAAGREISALDLARARGADGRVAAVAPPDAGLHADTGGGAEEVLDARARAAYRDRLAELRGEEEQARAWNDTERAARLASEIDFLARELGAALGRGGRPRTVTGDAERARISVTRALRAVIARLGDADAALGEHLTQAVRTGTFCSYAPDRRAG
ncbi:ATP-binding protein [Pseudonocardia saturnea]